MANVKASKIQAAVLVLLVAAFGLVYAMDSPPGGSSSRGMRAGKTHPQAEKSAEPGNRFDAAREEYKRVLKSVAHGEAGGVDTLYDLQREVYASEDFAGITKLHRFQLAMTTALGARNPTAIRPVVWMHYEVAGKHVGRQGWVMRMPTLVLVADMASSMGRMARRPENRRFATDMMLCSGYSFLGDGDKQRAGHIFDRIVRLDPGNPDALLGGAAIHERYGRYEQVVDRLDRMDDANPVADEGQLRLAVNLARLGREDRSIEVLQSLTEKTVTPWVRIVAYQELAKLLVRDDRQQDALAVLQEAVLRSPDDSGLKIQLAMVLDKNGRNWDAADVIESIEAAHVDGEGGPRWKYANWPVFDLQSHEVQLRQQAAAAADSLAQALDRES